MLNLQKVKSDYCKTSIQEAYQRTYSDMEKGLGNVIVWTAHLAWGAEKAGSVRPSRWVGLLSSNLMDRSRIEQPVERSGAKLVVWPARVAGNIDPGGPLPALALIDLSVPDALVAVETLVQAGVRVVAYGPHVNRDALRSAGRLGAEQVLARSVFFEKLADLLA